MAVPINKVTKVVSSGMKLRSVLKISFFLLFIFIMLINAVVISIDKTPIEGLTYLGLKFISPTEDINDASITIIANNGAFIQQEGRSFIYNVWLTILVHSKIISSLFIIYYWLKALAWLAMKMIIQDDSKSTASFLMAIIFFVLTQVIVLLLLQQSPMLPFDAAKNGFFAIKTIISPAADIADRFTSSSSSCDLNSTNCSTAETLENITNKIVNSSKIVAII